VQLLRLFLALLRGPRLGEPLATRSFWPSATCYASQAAEAQACGCWAASCPMARCGDRTCAGHLGHYGSPPRRGGCRTAYGRPAGRTVSDGRRLPGGRRGWTSAGTAVEL